MVILMSVPVAAVFDFQLTISGFVCCFKARKSLREDHLRVSVRPRHAPRRQPRTRHADVRTALFPAF